MKNTNEIKVVRLTSSQLSQLLRQAEDDAVEKFVEQLTKDAKKCTSLDEFRQKIVERLTILQKKKKI